MFTKSFFGENFLKPLFLRVCLGGKEPHMQCIRECWLTVSLCVKVLLGLKLQGHSGKSSSCPPLISSVSSSVWFISGVGLAGLQ